MYAVIGDNLSVDLADFSVTIDSTPLDSSDSTGSVGDFSLSAFAPEDPTHSIYSISLENLADKEITVYDPEGWAGTPDGELLGGIVTNVSHSDDFTLLITGRLALGALNVRNVTQGPYNGTLKGLIERYLRGRLISGTSVTVHPDIADRKITVPGWRGELWYHLKLLCAAESVEFHYPSTGYAELRPVRRTHGKTQTSRNISRETNAEDLAQYVEVKEYNNVWVTNQIFYPPGGWDEGVSIISISPGDTEEHELNLEGSVQSIQQPVMRDFVAKDHTTSSVYTIVADDGYPIQPAQWADAGGSVKVEIGEDTRTLKLTIRAPEGLHKDNGEPVSSFALALSAGESSPQYSTLRIVGTGVWFSNDDPVKFPTGVSAEANSEFEVGEEVGVSIDNLFLSTRAHVATAVYRAASKYQGYKSTISGNVTRLSDEGTFTEDAGSRVFYDSRPYRVRSATYTPDGVQFNAEDDLTCGDIQAEFDGMTWQDVQDLYEGLTYKEVLIKGMVR